MINYEMLPYTIINGWIAFTMLGIMFGAIIDLGKLIDNLE